MGGVVEKIVEPIVKVFSKAISWLIPTPDIPDFGLNEPEDFETGVYTFSWNNRRWNKLIQNDWIKVWRHRNRTTQKYNIYKISFKGKQLIRRVYRIMLGLDDIPMSERRNKLVAGDSYTDKVMYQAMTLI